MLEVEKKIGDCANLGLSYLGDVLGGNVLFLDIETTGLSARNAALYLIGVAYLKDGEWTYRQWFADSVRDEQDMLKGFAEFAAGYDALVHFNGTTFDLPFLKKCAMQYHIELGIDDKQSIDLYSRLRHLKGFLGMTSLKQKDFEERIGIRREDKFTGGELIEVYKKYEKEPTAEAKEILLLHNRDDLLGMLDVARLLDFERIFKGRFALKTVEDADTLHVRLRLGIGDGGKAPVDVEYESGDDFKISISEDEIVVGLLVKDGCVKMFFSDYKNYFYLPEEDKAVHKSVGAYVDSHFRQKATRVTAYQWVRVELLEKNPEQLDTYLHSLFEHYI